MGDSLSYLDNLLVENQWRYDSVRDIGDPFI